MGEGLWFQCRQGPVWETLLKGLPVLGILCTVQRGADGPVNAFILRDNRVQLFSSLAFSSSAAREGPKQWTCFVGDSSLSPGRWELQGKQRWWRVHQPAWGQRDNGLLGKKQEGKILMLRSPVMLLLLIVTRRWMSQTSWTWSVRSHVRAS